MSVIFVKPRCITLDDEVSTCLLDHFQHFAKALELAHFHVLMFNRVIADADLFSDSMLKILPADKRRKFASTY